MLTCEYELFKMEPTKGVQSMNSPFTNSINKLKRLGKSFIEEETLKKILRSLTIERDAKKSATEESQRV